jgi:hypothetical protein
MPQKKKKEKEKKNPSRICHMSKPQTNSHLLKDGPGRG